MVHLSSTSSTTSSVVTTSLLTTVMTIVHHANAEKLSRSSFLDEPSNVATIVVVSVLAAAACGLGLFLLFKRYSKYLTFLKLTEKAYLLILNRAICPHRFIK